MKFIDKDGEISWGKLSPGSWPHRVVAHREDAPAGLMGNGTSCWYVEKGSPGRKDSDGLVILAPMGVGMHQSSVEWDEF